MAVIFVVADVRKIIHIDMDAFYASVEQRDHVQYRGKPVIVGGSPTSRGVVATCSYEARRFGIHSAMPASTAYRLCPDAVFVRPRMDVYREVSAEIMAIFRSYTDLVEPLSLDEAYLDVTHSTSGVPSGTLIAREIKQKIVDSTGLTGSAGVSYNKFIAKIASDYRKPDGLTVIRPEQAQAFLDAVPIGKFFGVGRVTEQRFRQLGVLTGKDLRQMTRSDLARIFFDRGHLFYDLIRGIDPRPVQPNRTRKSLGIERTFATDIDDVAELKAILTGMADSVANSLRGRSLRCRTVVLKIKYENFRQITRRTTAVVPVETAADIARYAEHLLQQVTLESKVRLIGLTVGALEPANNNTIQLTLF